MSTIVNTIDRLGRIVMGRERFALRTPLTPDECREALESRIVPMRDL